MNDISLEKRLKVLGERIKTERKRLGLSQEKLAARVTAEINKEFKCADIAQSTINNWENGKAKVGIDRLLALSKIFQCDCGYLLGDYDQKTHDALEMHKALGLSEDAINRLTFLNNWGIDEFIAPIDILIRDNKYKNMTSDRSYRSILDLLHFFFSYSGSNKKWAISSNGIPYERKDTDGTISLNAIALDDDIVENAILNEIQQALRNLKKTTIKEANNG